MTISEIYRAGIERLTPSKGRREAVAIMREIMSHYLNLDNASLLLKGDNLLLDSTCKLIQDVVERVENGEPLQYITGEAWFHGLKLKVNESVLIPRPETSQLVDIICDDLGSYSDLKIIDIGTGSGAIAIALSRALKFPQITGVDISDKALDMAHENSKLLKCQITWKHADALALPPSKKEWDVVVSNPPYIPYCEIEETDVNVRDYEPALALFVPDSTPIIFYEKIARWSCDALTPGGHIYFEINPHYASMIKDLLQRLGFSDIDIIKDIESRDRFVKATMAKK